ncbi:ECF RNA polymerase sigma factor SigW [termite gut metagenome]|jgi:RNA polymerase sigma factor (sigma-70 family)|uniref:ECF RNA polymerase sigma factor SigW n=1 Tax=termite gut metagenome TaxID=433724 RepID=A0A5J4S3L0_9ZZZZ
MTSSNHIQSGLPQNPKVAEVFAKYHSQLKGFISKRVPSKEDCEDILQDVFYQLAKVNLEENPIRQISAWLYSVARNRIIDRNRKQKEAEMPYYPGDEEDLLAEEISRLLPDETFSPETALIRSLIWEELEIALSELPDDQRTVFELTELDGFPFKEISESTGISVNTLISRKRYAVLHLRKRLYDWYEEFWS